MISDAVYIGCGATQQFPDSKLIPILFLTYVKRSRNFLLKEQLDLQCPLGRVQRGHPQDKKKKSYISLSRIHQYNGR